MRKTNAQHMAEATEPDFEINGPGDVFNAMLKGHIDLDNERFETLSDAVKSIQKKIDLATIGVFGAVGVAVLNLVLKH